MQFGTKVHMKAWGRMEMKIYINELGHMTNMAAMPIYAEPKKIVFSRTKWPMTLKLDPVYDKVKFGHISFCMGKSENYLFFRKYCSLRSQSCLKHSAKWVNEVEWVSMQVLPRLFKSWPWVDLDLFYPKVIFGEMWKLFFFLETIAALWLKVA